MYKNHLNTLTNALAISDTGWPARHFAGPEKVGGGIRFSVRIQKS
jgi:hypothetical protein